MFDINANPELKRRMDADDPAALYEYSRLVEAQNPAEAYKYFVLAAQLGNPYAMEIVGDEYLRAGDTESAALYYKGGAKAGILDCSVKLSVLNIPYRESASVSELEDLAQIGVVSACKALYNYYKERGNKKQAAYWKSLAK